MKRKEVNASLLCVRRMEYYLQKQICKKIDSESVREGTVKSIQKEEGEKDLEIDYLKAFDIYTK